MSAPDELAEMKPTRLKEIREEHETDVRRAATGKWYLTRPAKDIGVLLEALADADRVIAARDAENAQLLKNCQRYIELSDSAQAMLLDMTQRADAAQAEIAARDARIAELEAGSDVQIWFYLKMKNHELTQALASRDAEIAEARERIRELEPAAECWDALCKCYRITCMGSAGLHDTKHANGYAHATFNLWTVAPGHEPTGAKDAQSLHGADMFGRFTQIAIKNHPLTPSNVPAEPSGGEK